MRRLYSGFPSGAPGVGLLLLRVVVGATLVVQLVPSLSMANQSKLAGFALGWLTLAMGVCLVVGILTRFAAAFAAALAACISFVPVVATASIRNHSLGLNVVALAIAVVLLGPGALSLDGVLFGRRRIIIPRPSLSSKP